MSRTAAPLVRERPAGSMPDPGWPPGLTPCRRLPDVFDVIRTALDRAAAAHLCREHCPALAACLRDREWAPPAMLADRVWAGRLDYSSGCPVKLHDLPGNLCPLGPGCGS